MEYTSCNWGQNVDARSLGLVSAHPHRTHPRQHMCQQSHAPAWPALLLQRLERGILGQQVLRFRHQRDLGERVRVPPLRTSFLPPTIRGWVLRAGESLLSAVSCKRSAHLITTTPGHARFISSTGVSRAALTVHTTSGQLGSSPSEATYSLALSVGHVSSHTSGRVRSTSIVCSALGKEGESSGVRRNSIPTRQVWCQRTDHRPTYQHCDVENIAYILHRLRVVRRRPTPAIPPRKTV